MYIFLALMTLTGWGISPLIIKKSYDRSPVIHALVARPVISPLLAWPAAVILGMDFSSFWGTAVVAVFTSFTYITFLEGLKRANVSMTAAFTSFYPLLSILLGVLLVNERTNVFQVVAVGGVVLGIALMGQRPRATVPVYARQPVLAGSGGPQVSLAPASPGVSGRQILAGTSSLGLGLILVTTLGYGITPIMIKGLVHSSGAYFLMSSLIRPAVTAAYAGYLRSNGSWQGAILPRDPWLWLGTMITVGADMAALVAMMVGPIAVVVPLCALYPLVTMLLARVFLHDRLSRPQTIGLATSVCFMALTLLAGKLG